MALTGQELEIKLRGSADDVAALRRSRLMTALNTGDSAWERLVSTYYDTPDGTLAKAGTSLRLREGADGLKQTVKSRNGSFARHEEERALQSGDAFPEPPGDEGLAALIAEAEHLAPVARTVTDRCAMVIEKRRARIEAAFDIGRAEAFRDGAQALAAPVAEAELELIDGSPDVLFNVARLCLEESEGRLRLSATSKEAQARRLLDGSGAINPEENLPLEPHSSVGDAFAMALIAAAVRVIEVAPAITDFRLPEGVHQMRVALRRFRVVERVLRDVIDSKKTRSLSRRARRFSRALGPARDWDVFLEVTLPPLKARGVEAEGFAKLETAATALRAEAWQRASARIGSLRFNKFALDLLAAGHVQSWRKEAGAKADEPARSFAERALDARLADARSVADAISGITPAERHPLRIALKKLRYLAQTFRALYPRESRKPYMTAMSSLQDALGAINDAVIAQTLAAEAADGQGKGASRAAGFICGFRAAEAEAASKALAEHWAEFERMTPFWREGGKSS
jgi:inorganic triphosphatase YgiF